VTQGAIPGKNRFFHAQVRHADRRAEGIVFPVWPEFPEPGKDRCLRREKICTLSRVMSGNRRETLHSAKAYSDQCMVILLPAKHRGLLRAFLCLSLFGLAAIPARGEAPDSSAQKQALDKATQRASGCEASRASQRSAFLKMLSYSGHPFEDLKNPEKVDRIASNDCMYTWLSMVEQKHGYPCKQSYLKSIRFMVSADSLTRESCESFRAAAAKAGECDLGSAACFGEVSRNLAAAKGKLNEASDLNKQILGEMKKLGGQALLSARVYADRLAEIGRSLRAIQKAHPGKPIVEGDHDLEAALLLDDNERLNLTDIRQLNGIPDLKPESFERKSQLLLRQLNSKTASPSDDSPFAQQLRAAINTDEVSDYARKSDARIQSVSSSVESEITTFDNLSKSYGSLGNKPAAQPGFEMGSPSASGASAPTPTKTAMAARPAPAAESVSLLPVQSSSSPVSASLRTGSSTTPAKRASLGASSRPVPGTSPAPAAGTLAGHGTTQGVPPGSPLLGDGPAFTASRAAPSRGSGTVPEEVGATPSTTLIVYNRKSDRLEAPGDPTPAAMQPAPPTAGARANFLPFRDARWVQPPPPQGDLSRASPQQVSALAADFTTRELARIEATEPLSPSLRDQLRAKLSADFTQRMGRAQEASREAQAGGSAGTLESFLEAARKNLAGDTGDARFRMLSADTEREVQRLMGNGGGDSAASGDETLFSRVHGAYLRAIR
jgi:hypothetical protein